MTDTPREPMAELAARLVEDVHRLNEGIRNGEQLRRIVADITEAAAALRDTSARPTDEALREALDTLEAEMAIRDENRDHEAVGEAIATLRAALLTQENSDG